MGAVDRAGRLYRHGRAFRRRIGRAPHCALESADQMSLTSLCSLFTDDRRADSPVAQNADTTIDFARFRVDVAWNALRLRRHGCRHGLLHTRDCYWGAVGLFALLHAGAEVVIPQNAQPKSLAAISDAWDLMVCDEVPKMVDGAVLLEPGGQGEGHELGALDRSTPVSFF